MLPSRSSLSRVPASLPELKSERKMSVGTLETQILEKKSFLKEPVPINQNYKLHQPNQKLQPHHGEPADRQLRVNLLTTHSVLNHLHESTRQQKARKLMDTTPLGKRMEKARK